MKQPEPVHPRWIGFLFWSASLLSLYFIMQDKIDAVTKLDLLLTGSVLMIVGIILAPTKDDNDP